jgi:hypothetical protein
MKRFLLTAFIFFGVINSAVFAQGTSCTNAITIPLDGTCNSYSVSTSSSPSWALCNYGGGPGRITYFKFTTNSTPQCVSLDITTSTANVPLEATLWSGCSSGNVTGGDGYQSICMDDGSGIWASNLWWSNLNANTTYYLRVKTFSGFTGALQICGKHDTPTNNLCSGSTGIDTLTTINQNNACNTGSTEVLPATLCAGSLENTAWYTFTVLSTGVSSVVISNLNCDNTNLVGGGSADYGFQIGFFTGNCGSLTPTNCQAQTGAAGGAVIASSTSLPAGTVVHVAIDGFAGSNCKYSILAINAAPLSVKMKVFEGWRGNDFNLLTWVTSAETNHQYFEVERSNDGINFSPLGKVDGAINSSVEKRYSFNDEKPLSHGYYRLKQVDTHNGVTYSRIIRIDRPVTSKLTATFENPVHDILKTNLETSVAGMAQVRIVDVSGKPMFAESISLQKGSNQYLRNLGKLVPGTYYLVITTDNVRKTFPFIKF